MLRIATHNVNGIRAAVRRGYRAWVDGREPDVICLQEVRAARDQIPSEAIDGFRMAYHPGSRAGRDGVAVLSRTEPGDVRIGFGSAEFDPAGRYIEVDLPDITVGSLYLPKGDVYGEKFEVKMRFMDQFAGHLRAATDRARASGREFVVCGDFNIAHTEADIKAWKANLKSEGFLPEERSWYGAQVVSTVPRDPANDAVGGPDLVDVLRHLNPDRQGPYSWWSWRGRAFDNDAGWRIDHHWATAGLARRAVRGQVDRAPSYAERISDHAPVVVDYDV